MVALAWSLNLNPWLPQLLLSTRSSCPRQQILQSARRERTKMPSVRESGCYLVYISYISYVHKLFLMCLILQTFLSCHSLMFSCIQARSRHQASTPGSRKASWRNMILGYLLDANTGRLERPTRAFRWIHHGASPTGARGGVKGGCKTPPVGIKSSEGRKKRRKE